MSDKIKFQEIEIGQTFHQFGTGDCTMRKVKNATHNAAGRAEVVKDALFPKSVGEVLTVNQNRNCVLV